MFESARRLRFQGYEIVVLASTREYRNELAELHEDLLSLATFARGWGPEALPRMRQVFKIEPFYRATSLVLVFDGPRLSGTAGVDNDFAAQRGDAAIFHLCSVNLLDPLKKTGLPALFILLLADELLCRLTPDQPVYFTSISQSPQVYRLLGRLAKVYPDGGTAPPADVREIARIVAAKYDPHVEFDAERLVLRNECDFFYKELPYVADASLNALFDRELNLRGGDVFLSVAKCRAGEAGAAAERYRRRLSTTMEAA